MSPPPPPLPDPPATTPSQPEHRRLDDDALRLLAAQSVAAIRGEALPAEGDPRSARRVLAVVEAITDARRRTDG